MDRGSEQRRFVRNAIGSYGARAVLILSALLLTPYLYRTLGPGGFGTWSVIFSLTTVFSLIQLGVAAGPIKLVAEYRAQGRRRELENVVGASVSALLALGVVALGLAALGASVLDGLASPAARDDFRLGMLALGVAFLVRFPCTAYMAVLEGYQRYDLSNATWMVTTLVSSVGAVVAVEAGTGVLGVAVAYAIAIVASSIVTGFLLHRLDPELSLRPRLGDSGARGRLLHFSTFALLADSMVFVGQRMDVVVVAAIRNAAQTAPYAAAVKLQSGVQSLVLPFIEMLMPMMSELWARGERAEVARRFTLATRVALQVTLPVAAAFALFAADVVQLWLGSEAAAEIVVALMAVQVLTMTLAPAEKVLIGVGRVRTAGVLACVEGVTNVALSIALVFTFGAVGAALGTLLTTALVSPVKIPLAARAIGQSTTLLVRDGIARPILSSLPALAAMVLVRLLLEQGPLRLALGLAVGLGAAAVVGARQLGGDRLRTLVRAGSRPRPLVSDPLDSDLPAQHRAP